MIAKRIKTETLEQIFKVLLSSSFIADEILFLWHASEPLVLPTSFYKRAFQLQEEWNHKRVRIANAFQTNATLITQKWCQFFKDHNIHVGVSLDGPQHIHDANRQDKTGKGSFERTMRGIELLQTNNIPYAVISVVTSASILQPDQFWQFFSELDLIGLGLNPEEKEGINTWSSLRTDEDIKHYKHFLKYLLIMNEESQHPIAIREIEKLKYLVDASPQPIYVQQANIPMAIISFDCDGNFSTFSPELLTLHHADYGDLHFGNVFENSLEEIFNNAKFQRVQKDIQQGIERCKASCAYFPVCGGGSPSNKLSEHGTFSCTETIACRLQIQVPTDVVLEYLEEKYYIISSSHDSNDFKVRRR
jgi:uncharacterized protein